MDSNHSNCIGYIKKQPISTLLIVLIWVVCMMPIPETPLDKVRFIDKWTHLVMFGSLAAVILAEYGWRKSEIVWKRCLIAGIILPAIMGGLVELAQAYLTNGVRSGDWLDFLADTIGALLGGLIGIPLARYLSTRRKGGRS